jgi:signal transduction histidine kinase
VYNWVPEGIALALFERATQLLHEKNVAYEVGASTLNGSIVGAAYLIAYGLAHPRRVYEEISMFPPYLDERAKLAVQFTGSNSALITMDHPMEHDKSRHICSYVRGLISSVPTLWGLPPAVVREKQCILPVEQVRQLENKADGVDQPSAISRSDTITMSEQQPAVGSLKGQGTLEVNGVVYGANVCVYEVSWVDRLPWYKRLVPFLRKRMPSVTDDRTLKEEAIREIERDKQLSQKMHELQQLKSEFLLTLADGLKRRINLLKSSSDLLIKDVDQLAPSSLTSLANLIDSSVEEIEEVVSRLTYIASLKWGELDIAPTPYNVAMPIVSRVTRMTSATVGKGQQIGIEALPSGAMTIMPLHRFNMVLDNFLSNAHRFTPEGGRISVALRNERKRFTVAVSDTGIGIPQEEQKQVFDMSYRCRNVRVDGMPGSGLGLWIAKQLVEMYAGKIWVTSTVGKGSTFYFSLPIATG